MEFPMWLVFALLSPFFWAVVHVLDSYCMDEVFDLPVLATVGSGFTMLAALPLLAVGLLFTGWQEVGADVLLLCLLTGGLYMASQWLYFRALAISESGIVASYWNLTPVLVMAAGYLFLGEVLAPVQYLGAGVLIAAAVLFCLLDGTETGRWRTFLLMAGGCMLQAGYFLMQKVLFDRCAVYQVFVLTTAGMAACALLPLALGRYRRGWVANWPKVRKAVPFLLVIEVCNLMAVGLSQVAVSLGPVSLVASVEASMPAYTFGVSVALWAIFRKYGEEEAKQRLVLKLLLVAAMVFGVWLVS
jgi:drug/metabolite transporter (DMT)-like permease